MIRLLMVFLLISFTSQAQVTSVAVGIDGLTCSMCSNSVEKSVRKLDFVFSLEMDLNENTAEVFIQENKQVDFNALAKKVEDAGYSVRFMNTVLDFPEIRIAEGTMAKVNGLEFRFVNVKEGTISGKTQVRVIGKCFVPRKDYPFWNRIIHPYLKEDKSRNIYYITL